MGGDGETDREAPYVGPVGDAGESHQRAGTDERQDRGGRFGVRVVGQGPVASKVTQHGERSQRLLTLEVRRAVFEHQLAAAAEHHHLEQPGVADERCSLSLTGRQLPGGVRELFPGRGLLQSCPFPCFNYVVNYRLIAVLGQAVTLVATYALR